MTAAWPWDRTHELVPRQVKATYPCDRWFSFDPLCQQSPEQRDALQGVVKMHLTWKEYCSPERFFRGPYHRPKHNRDLQNYATSQLSADCGCQRIQLPVQSHIQT
eukprot:763448-Hanusia_phi.AAC.4